MRAITTAISTVLLATLPATAGKAAAQDADGFVSIFDGSTLEGWEGDPA